MKSFPWEYNNETTTIGKLVASKNAFFKAYSQPESGPRDRKTNCKPSSINCRVWIIQLRGAGLDFISTSTQSKHDETGSKFNACIPKIERLYLYGRVPTSQNKSCFCHNSFILNFTRKLGGLSSRGYPLWPYATNWSCTRSCKKAYSDDSILGELFHHGSSE